MNYSNRNFSARNDVNGGEGKVAAGNFQHGTSTGCREGSAHGGCFQNSKIIDKTTQSQSCGVSSTQDGQAVKVRSKGDIKENEMWDISQKVEACAESSIPFQLDAPYLVTRMGERSTLQSSCKSTLNVESNVEVTSPQKQRYWAQMQEAKADHVKAQEVTKNQRGKGRIKKIAREKGQTQRKEKQALGLNSGTKHQIALLFTEGEVENLDNSVRKRKCEGFACVDHGVHGSVITGVAHGVHDGIAQGVKSDDANVVQTGVALGVHSVAHEVYPQNQQEETISSGEYWPFIAHVPRVLVDGWNQQEETSSPEPSDAEPSNAEPSNAEPSDAEPYAEPSDAEPYAEPSDAEPCDAEPSDTEPTEAKNKIQNQNRRKFG
nr:hypothetical protein CFP56_45471 [Quercus suber]